MKVIIPLFMTPSGSNPIRRAGDRRNDDQNPPAAHLQQDRHIAPSRPGAPRGRVHGARRGL